MSMLADAGGMHMPFWQVPFLGVWNQKPHEIRPCIGQPSRNYWSKHYRIWFFSAHLVSFQNYWGKQKKVSRGWHWPKSEGTWASCMLGPRQNWTCPSSKDKSGTISEKLQRLQVHGKIVMEWKHWRAHFIQTRGREREWRRLADRLHFSLAYPTSELQAALRQKRVVIHGAPEQHTFLKELLESEFGALVLT